MTAMKRNNQLLPDAMEALINSGLIKDNTILKEYDGYVAAFGPSVLTAGLRVTLAFYTDGGRESRKDKTQRIQVLNVLQKIYEKKNGLSEHTEGLLKMSLEADEDQLRRMKSDLIDCATALKLVMRNFKQVEKLKKNEKSETDQTPV
jgi:CRISPR/Cas system CMR-associated protein Cmr5 small subunit